MKGPFVLTWVVDNFPGGMRRVVLHERAKPVVFRRVSDASAAFRRHFSITTGPHRNITDMQVWPLARWMVEHGDAVAETPLDY